MKGRDIISLIGTFVRETEVDVHRVLYDGDVFGNYDIVFHYRRIGLTLNCDRGFLSVMISDPSKRRSPAHYSEILAGSPAGHQHDHRAFSDPERLDEVLSAISSTIGSVEEHYVAIDPKLNNR